MAKSSLPQNAQKSLLGSFLTWPSFQQLPPSTNKHIPGSVSPKLTASKPAANGRLVGVGGGSRKGNGYEAAVEAKRQAVGPVQQLEATSPSLIPPTTATSAIGDPTKNSPYIKESQNGLSDLDPLGKLPNKSPILFLPQLFDIFQRTVRSYQSQAF